MREGQKFLRLQQARRFDNENWHDIEPAEQHEQCEKRQTAHGGDFRQQIKHQAKGDGVLRQQRHMRSIKPKELADERWREIHAERRAQQIVLVIVVVADGIAVRHKVGENGVAHEPICVCVKEMTFAAKKTQRQSQRPTASKKPRVDGGGQKQRAGRRSARDDIGGKRASKQQRRSRRRFQAESENSVGENENQRGDTQQRAIREARRADARCDHDRSIDAAAVLRRRHGKDKRFARRIYIRIYVERPSCREPGCSSPI